MNFPKPMAILNITSILNPEQSILMSGGVIYIAFQTEKRKRLAQRRMDWTSLTEIKETR
jgi:hypothetical protein